MKKVYLLFLLFPLFSHAQLEVTTNISDETLLDWIEGAGVEVSNLTIDCDSNSYGQFVNPDLENGLEVFDGILFCTGNANDAVGPNDNTASSPMGENTGDSDLEQSLPGFVMNDVCRVEFDVVPDFGYLLFNYVFGSEEYPEWVGTSFNDVFGFFVSGPGIEGEFSNSAENFSVVPGTELPVSINNVNEGLNSEYFVANGDGISEPFSADSTFCNYDGLTTNLPGLIIVESGESYHIKIVIADAGDMVLDSGIFLQRESLMSVESIGVVENSIPDFQIYPNPVSEEIFYSFSGKSEMESYAILAIDGRMIRNVNFTSLNNRIDVSDLSTGTYILQIRDDQGQTSISQFVKE